MWGSGAKFGAFIVVFILLGPAMIVQSNKKGEDATPTFSARYKDQEKRSMRSFWKINHPQSYQVLDMRVRIPSDGSSRFEIVSIGDVMESMTHNASMLPIPGDALEAIDGIPVAIESLQNVIQNFMMAGGDDRTKIMDQQVVIPLVHATDSLEEEDHWFCYQDRYEDVQQKVRKYDAQAIRNHYVLTGRAEGRDPKCEPGTPPNKHGYRVRGFMYVNLVGLYQPDSFTFAPTDPARRQLISGKKIEAASKGRSRSDRSDGRSRQRRENPNKKTAEEEKRKEHDNERRRRAMEKKERGSSETSQKKVLTREQEEAEKKRRADMKAEEERMAELERMRNTAEMKKQKLEEEQRMRELWKVKRRDGEEFEYWMRVELEGPMGLTFNMGQSISQVQEVRPGSVASQHEVEAGDQLIAVNGRDVSKMGPNSAIRILSSSEWPRILEFRAPAKKKKPVDDVESISTVLRITSPSVLQGDFKVSTAEWGGEFPSDCRPYLIVDSTPANGCGSSSDVIRWRAKEADPIVLVRRGQCAYTDKARAIQRSGSATAAIVVNSDNKLIDMPSGKALVDDIDIPFQMLPADAGAKIYSILGWNVPVRGWIGQQDECQEMIPQYGKGEGSPFKNNEKGGRFDVQTASQLRSFDWKLATFGPELNDLSAPIIMADPPTGKVSLLTIKLNALCD